MLLVPAGCFSPVTLHRAVMAYDENVFRATSEQLLVNILSAGYRETRAREHQYLLIPVAGNKSCR